MFIEEYQIYDLIIIFICIGWVGGWVWSKIEFHDRKFILFQLRRYSTVLLNEFSSDSSICSMN